jgi:hypothetical protein
MTNKTIHPDKPTFQSERNAVSDEVRACSLMAEKNNRLSISIIDSLHALNAQLNELDNVLKTAYGNAG